MVFRHYDPERDCAACHRIWTEVGWITPARTLEEMRRFFERSGQGWVEA